MASKPIRVRLTRDTPTYPKGSELGFASEKDAASVLGEGTFEVTGLQNGQPYEAPKKPAAKGGDEK
jgi:hypothetical protein